MNQCHLLRLIVIVVAATVSCRPPDSPAELQSSDSSPTTPKQIPVGSENSIPVVGGAPVGVPEMQKKVSDCLAKKMFYDRQSSAADKCTTMPIAEVSCQLPDAANGSSNIKSIMTPVQATEFDKYLGDETSLKGYLLDQCLDCSTAAASTFAPCKVAGAPVSAKIVKLYFVKPIGTDISIKTLELVR